MEIMLGLGAQHANSIASTANAKSVVFLVSDRFTKGRLAQLNSKMCRPLDGPAAASTSEDGTDDTAEEPDSATAAS